MDAADDGALSSTSNAGDAAAGNDTACRSPDTFAIGVEAAPATRMPAMPRAARLPPSGAANANRGPASGARRRRQPAGLRDVGLLGREPEVARPGRDGRGRQGGRDRAQVVVQGGALVARGDEVAGLLEVGALGVPGGERGDQEQVVVAVVGQVRHQSPSPRNRPIEPSSRSRSASRPRWIRDFTVPSDTPVSSAISA